MLNERTGQADGERTTALYESLPICDWPNGRQPLAAQIAYGIRRSGSIRKIHRASEVAAIRNLHRDSLYTSI